MTDRLADLAVLARFALCNGAIWTAGPAGHERASHLTCPAGILLADRARPRGWGAA
jgi:hypothetical protein